MKRKGVHCEKQELELPELYNVARAVRLSSTERGDVHRGVSRCGATLLNAPGKVGGGLSP